MNKRHFLLTAAAAATLALGSTAALAQAYPNKPIRIVVPFPASGTSDVLARLVGQKMSEKLGATVVVDNKPGAGGAIGSDLAAKAPADGYTLLLATTSTHAIGPSISRRNYEVGPEFIERFLAVDKTYRRYFTPSSKADHAMFDLPGLTTQRLRDAGVTAENLDLCTYPDEERFFSYRRTTHRQEPDYGRQISAIMITA